MFIIFVTCYYLYFLSMLHTCKDREESAKTEGFWRDALALPGADPVQRSSDDASREACWKRNCSDWTALRIRLIDETGQIWAEGCVRIRYEWSERIEKFTRKEHYWSFEYWSENMTWKQSVYDAFCDILYGLFSKERNLRKFIKSTNNINFL